MKKILLSIGDAKAEAAIMNELNKRQPHTYSQARVATYRDAVLQIAQQEQPDIVVISEKLKGSSDLLKLIYELKTTVPNVRVVYIGSQKQQGDQTQQKLIMLGVYDQLLSSTITLHGMVDLIEKPKTFADVVGGPNTILNGKMDTVPSLPAKENKEEDKPAVKTTNGLKQNSGSIDEVININELFSGNELEPQTKETKKNLQPGIYVPPTTTSHIDYLAGRMGLEREPAPKQEEKGFEIDLDFDTKDSELVLANKEADSTKEMKLPKIELPKDVEIEIYKTPIPNEVLDTTEERKKDTDKRMDEPKEESVPKNNVPEEKQEQPIAKVKETNGKKDNIIRSSFLDNKETEKPSFLVGNVRDNEQPKIESISIPEELEVINLSDLEEEVEETDEAKLISIKEEKQAKKSDKQAEKPQQPKTDKKNTDLTKQAETVKEKPANKSEAKEQKDNAVLTEKNEVNTGTSSLKQRKTFCFVKVNDYTEAHDALNFAYLLAIKGKKVLYVVEEHNKNYLEISEDGKLHPVKESVADITNIDYTLLDNKSTQESFAKINEYDYVVFDVEKYFFDDVSCCLLLAGVQIIALSSQNKAEIEDLNQYFGPLAAHTVLALTEYEDGLISSKAITKKNIWKKVVRIRTNRVSNYNCATSNVPLLAKKNTKEAELYQDLLNALEV